MQLKEKGWLWKLTWPFAHANYTTVGHTIYHPKGMPPTRRVIAHEEVHERQWMQEGFVKFYLLYLLVLPLFWNPWRFKWEYEAYEQGSKYDHNTIRSILRSAGYGWLKNK